MTIDPVNTWCEFGEDSAGRLEHYIVDLGLLLGKSTIDWERDGDIGAVVMERVSLICQHGLTIDQRPVIVLVMQRRSCRSAATDRKVGLHATYVIVLLTSIHEETLKLTFTHAWLAVLHD